MGEDRMKSSTGIQPLLSENSWNDGLEKIKRQFAATSGELAAEGGRVWINPTRGTIVGIPNNDSKLTKKGWYLAWRDMVSLCSRALQYKVEAERRVQEGDDQIAEMADKKIKINKDLVAMVKSFDELGEKYTKDMDALMKLLILLGSKIDE